MIAYLFGWIDWWSFAAGAMTMCFPSLIALWLLLLHESTLPENNRDDALGGS